MSLCLTSEERARLYEALAAPRAPRQQPPPKKEEEPVVKKEPWDDDPTERFLAAAAMEDAMFEQRLAPHASS